MVTSTCVAHSQPVSSSCSGKPRRNLCFVFLILISEHSAVILNILEEGSYSRVVTRF